MLTAADIISIIQAGLAGISAIAVIIYMLMNRKTVKEAVTAANEVANGVANVVRGDTMKIEKMSTNVTEASNVSETSSNKVEEVKSISVLSTTEKIIDKLTDDEAKEVFNKLVERLFK